jgi:hypothetical protein
VAVGISVGMGVSVGMEVGLGSGVAVGVEVGRRVAVATDKVGRITCARGGGAANELQATAARNKINPARMKAGGRERGAPVDFEIGNRCIPPL